jgi:hypothetical protein
MAASTGARADYAAAPIRGVVEDIGMARWRQPGAHEMLQAFLLLNVVAFLFGLLSRPHNQ